MTKALWSSTIFLSAFLAFQVQPLIAKMILPDFGGAAGVWTTCLVFFQAALLLGYAYAYGLVRWIPSRFQSHVHAGVLALSVLALPLHTKDVLQGAEPSWRVLAALALGVGLPFLVLASTSPLLQAWYPRGAGAGVYRFYAVSNAGSLIALVTYPVLFEPYITVRHQAAVWSAGYVLAVGASAAAAFIREKSIAQSSAPEELTPPTRGTIAMWVALPACSTALLLAITHHLSQNLAAIPLLWIIPLSLYLLTFIIAFAGRGAYHRHFWMRLLAVALASLAYALDPRLGSPSLVILIPLYCAGLFVCCLVCHGELARLKPATQRLTSFYFAMSLGGTLGGILVALIAPRVFSGFIELPLALGTCAVLALVALRRDPESPFYKARWQAAWLVAVGVAVVINAGLLAVVYRQRVGSRVMVRNFYGVLRETEEAEKPAPSAATGNARRVRTLLNGPIQHGSQFLSEDRRRDPTTYYGRHSGVGLALRAAGETGPIRVGAIGLGVGTVAAYGRPGDFYTFYEINPLVIELARRDFSFLGDSAAEIQVIEGDARLKLESEPPQNFDVLIADAFSGDAIPVHLLTREAFALYSRHLQPQGVLALHISNTYLYLRPVVARATQDSGRMAVLVTTRANDAEGTFHSSWVLVSANREILSSDPLRAAAVPLPSFPEFRPWTDDFSNLLGILKWVPE